MTTLLPNDLTKIKLKDLKLGDSFNMRGVFSGLSDEPTVWTLVETNFSKSDMIFNVTYYGVEVGEYCLNPASVGRVVEL